MRSAILLSIRHPLRLALAAPTVLFAANNTFVYDHVGGWTIRTDVDMDYRCYAEAEYDDGSIVQAGFNSPDGGFYISVSDLSWAEIEEGLAYPVHIEFDEAPTGEYWARGITLGRDSTQPGLRFTLTDTEQTRLMQFFKLQRVMIVRHADHAPLTLSLAGTSAAVDILEECQAQMVAASEGR